MNLLYDLRYSVRTIARQPFFTIVTVLVLALGIGANTAVFSIVNTVLLRPLPYPDPDRLVRVLESTSLMDGSAVSLPNYLDWRAGQKEFTDLAVLRSNTFNISVPQGGQTAVPERVNGTDVSANYLSVLGLRPELGRDFTESEDTPGGPKAVLIGDTLWRRLFNADPSVVGRSVVLDSKPYEIIGVLPPSLDYPRSTEMLVPLGDLRAKAGVNSRDTHPGFTVLGRMREGVTLTAAVENLNAVARELERRFPDSNTGRRVTARTLLDSQVGGYRLTLFLLLGAVACVLLIACANVANLQLARATGRTRELAVRAALGAGRGRLIRQLLTESTVLGLLGGLAGILMASWALDALVALVPAGIPRLKSVRMDWMALTFAAVAALGTGLLVGIWPAWRVSRLATMATALHESNARGGSSGAARVRVRSLLVVAQVAMSLVLLAGAGLALQSFWRIRSVPLGFSPEGILTMAISLPSAHYEKEKIVQFYDRLLERVRALPGVEAAACGDNIPFDNTEWDSGIHLTGTPPAPLGEDQQAEMSMVTPDYFKVMGMPILRGRNFDGRDVLGQAPVAIVDESFVRKYLPGKDPIGQHVDNNQTVDKNAPPLTIIGVVGRTLNDSPADSPYLEKLVQMYLGAAQFDSTDRQLLVRVGSGDPKQLVEPIRRAVLALDSELPIADITTMNESIATSMASQRLTMLLLGAFAVLALALAVLGLYGVMALGVTLRTREIGIRLALGAQRRNVLALILRQGIGLVVIGLVIGMAAALSLGHLTASLFYKTSGVDVLLLGGVCLVLLVAALLACWLPAWRAARLDPLVALREE